MPKIPLIIGLTGTNASGKGTVADYLKSLGFEYHSLSDVIRDELASKNIPATRENLISEGNRLRDQFGASILAKRIIEKTSNRNTVIDSIRNTKEVLEFRKLKNFIFISVDSPIEIRYERAKKRGRAENASSLEEFKAIEAREASKNSNEQQIDKCIKMADFKIVNEGTKEELNEKIAKIVKSRKG